MSWQCSSSSAPTTSTPSATTTATEAPSSTATAGSVARQAPLTAGASKLLPLATSAPSGDLSKYAGRRARTKGVSVLSVPADEGFWVGTSDSNRVWVQIVGKGESSYHVKTGDNVAFSGKVVGQSPSFARRVGVDASEGARQLTAQKNHIQVASGTVTLATR